MKHSLAIGILALALVYTCEEEPNDTLATATPLFARHASGLLAMGLLEPGDIDHFSFRARAGDVVTIALRDDSAGELADAVIAVYGPDGGEPIAVVDDVGRDLAPRLSFAVQASGRHTLAVAGFGDEDLDGGDHREDFDYLLTAVVSSHRKPVEESDRRGRNDDPRHADHAFLDRARLHPRGAAVVSGKLLPADVDHFLLPLVPGAVLTASLYDDADGEFNDSVLRLTNRHHELLARDDDAGPGFLSRVVYAAPEGRRPHSVILAVDGFDPDPGDDVPHEEDFRYRLVVTLEDAPGELAALAELHDRRSH